MIRNLRGLPVLIFLLSHSSGLAQSAGLGQGGETRFLPSFPSLVKNEAALRKAIEMRGFPGGRSGLRQLTIGKTKLLCATMSWGSGSTHESGGIYVRVADSWALAVEIGYGDRSLDFSTTASKELKVERVFWTPEPLRRHSKTIGLYTEAELLTRGQATRNRQKGRKVS